MSPKPKTEEWKEKPQNIDFWHTFPGIITAIAGLVTAMAGLILALHQVGLLGNQKEPASVATPISDTFPSSYDMAHGSSNAAGLTSSSEKGTKGAHPTITGYTISLPEGSTVTLNNHRAEGVYTVLKAEVEPKSSDKLNVKLTTRLTNKGNLGLSFSDNTFRLLIDDVPRAPINNLNEVVDARSAKEGEIIFEVPANARQLILQLNNTEDLASLPLVIKKVN